MPPTGPLHVLLNVNMDCYTLSSQWQLLPAVGSATPFPEVDTLHNVPGLSLETYAPYPNEVETRTTQYFGSCAEQGRSEASSNFEGSGESCKSVGRAGRADATIENECPSASCQNVGRAVKSRREYRKRVPGVTRPAKQCCAVVHGARMAGTRSYVICEEASRGPM